MNLKSKPDLAQAAPEIAPKPTPENTPPPGGGRWRWDISRPGWVDLDAAPAAETNAALPELPAH